MLLIIQFSYFGDVEKLFDTMNVMKIFISFISWFFVILTIFMVLLILLPKIFNKKGTSSSVIKHWAHSHGLKFQETGNPFKQIDRFSANKGKYFFNANVIMNLNDFGHFVEGWIGDRQVWVYEIVGKPFPGSGVGTTRSKSLYPDASTAKVERTFYGWCVEVETHRIPQKILITKKFIAGQDTHDTESRSFEKDYDVSSEEKNVLQLLDPVMMDLIHRSKVAAVEISDASVVLYYTMPKISYETLDSLLDYGLQIAQQVDRNFPLSKYNK